MAKRRAQRVPGRSSPPPAQVPEETAAPLFGPRAWLAPLVTFVGLLALYLWTLAPSAVGGDSGELTAAALTGGVPHPPGYPLFALLARAFAALPLGHSPAWRVSLASATFTAAAAALVCATVATWTRQAAAGLVAGTLFGTNEVVWLHANAAEVFGLNAFFVALACLLWLGAERTHARRFVFALALASGLAMSNHHTYAFVGVPLLARSLWVARRGLGGKGLAATAALGIVGLLPYAYLPLASSSAAVSWGASNTLGGFLDHVLRRNYGTFAMGRVTSGGAFSDEGTFFPTLWLMLGHAFPRFLWLGPALAVVGIVRGVRDARQRASTWVLLLTLGVYLFGYCALSNLSTSLSLYVTVLLRFTIASDLLIALAAGLGAAAVFRAIDARWVWASRRPLLKPAVAAGLFLLAAAAHASPCNQRHNRVFADFVSTALASLPRNAIVITMGDHLTGAVFYFHAVERLRPDVIHLDRELLGLSWYGVRQRRLHPDLTLPDGPYGPRGWNIKKLLDANPTRPVVVIDRLEGWDQSWKEGYKLASNGLVHPLVPVAQFPTFAEWAERDRAALGAYDVLPALRSPKGSWERALGEVALTTQSARAHLALVYSHDMGNAVEPARVAAHLIEDIVGKAGGDEGVGIRAFPGVPSFPLSANLWKDLGIAYETLSRADASFLPKVALAYERFVTAAAADDAELPAARRYLEQIHARANP